MTDERDPLSEPSVSESGSMPHSPGQWLREERERQGATVQRIAADMHLSTTVIEAIEQNRFKALGAPVFAKGHLRKYAKLLGLPIERVFELYAKLEDAPREVDPVPLTQRPAEPGARPDAFSDFGSSGASARRVWPWVVAAIGLASVGLAAWWWTRGAPAATRTEQERQSATSPTPQPPVSASIAVAPSDAKATPQVVAPVPDSLPTASPATPPASGPKSVKPMGTPPPGKVRIRLTFERESWAEVYDANGNRMLYGVGRVDLPRVLDVEPPATVVLGDATAVTTEANGKQVTIPRKNVTGSVARFAIAADGTAQ